MTKKQKDILAVIAKEILRLKKLLKLAPVLILFALPALAQAPETHALGVGTPSRTCSFQNTCIAPVLDTDGQPTLGTIEVIASLSHLTRRDIDGNILWTSSDYDYQWWTGNGSRTFTESNGLRGSLTYAMTTYTYRCGGSGRYILTCRYTWITGGSLTE